MFTLPVIEFVKVRQFWLLSVLRSAGLWSGKVDKFRVEAELPPSVAESVDRYRDVTDELFKGAEQMVPARYAAMMRHDAYRRGHGGALRQVR